MCDISVFNAFLAGAEASIIVALAFLATAIILNGGFFSAPGAPISLALAAVATAAAFVAVGSAIANLDSYVACKGTLGSCLGDYNSLSASLLFLSTVLGVQAVAFVAAIVPAFVPYIGAAPMIVISFTLTGLLVSISTTLVLYNQFMKCMSEQPSPWVIWLGVVVIVITAAILITSGPAIIRAIKAFKGPKWW